MDFGEQIHLDYDEQAALQFGDVFLPADWPATTDSFRELEHLILERIVDKRGLLDEMRGDRTLHQMPSEAFRLRRQLGVLYKAHEQLYGYAVTKGFDTTPPTTDE